MVKKSNNKKEKKVTCPEMVKSLYKFDTFSKDFPIWKLAVYSVILFAVYIGITSWTAMISNSINYTTSDLLLFNLIGIPVLILLSHTLFYVFANSYEKKRNPYWHSFFTFTSIHAPFLVILSALNLLSNLSSTLELVMAVLILVTLVYLVVNLVLNFKNYYKTSALVILSSLILANISIFYIIASAVLIVRSTLSLP